MDVVFEQSLEDNRKQFVGLWYFECSLEAKRIVERSVRCEQVDRGKQILHMSAIGVALADNLID